MSFLVLLDDVVANGIFRLAVLFANLIVEIGSIETGTVQVAVSLHSQGRNGIVDDLLIRSGRQCHDWDVGVGLSQTIQC